GPCRAVVRERHALFAGFVPLIAERIAVEVEARGAIELHTRARSGAQIGACIRDWRLIALHRTLGPEELVLVHPLADVAVVAALALVRVDRAPLEVVAERGHLHLERHVEALALRPA